MPGGSEITVSLVWENEHGQAGIVSGPKDAKIFLFSAEQALESNAQAVDLLRQILNDEVACVRAYAKECLVYCGLAPTSDPSAAFNHLSPSGSRSKNMPDIDYVNVETWSRGSLED